MVNESSFQLLQGYLQSVRGGEKETRSDVQIINLEFYVKSTQDKRYCISVSSHLFFSLSLTHACPHARTRSIPLYGMCVSFVSHSHHSSFNASTVRSIQQPALKSISLQLINNFNPRDPPPLKLSKFQKNLLTLFRAFDLPVDVESCACLSMYYTIQ